VRVFAHLADIVVGRWRDDVERCRAALEQSKESYDQEKRKLPAVTFAGVFTVRSKNGFLLPSGFLVLDLDAGDNPQVLDSLEAAAKVRDRLLEWEHCAAAWVSPSGLGVKLLVAVDSTTCAEKFADLFRAACAQLHERFGLVADPSGKDVSRLCFVSWDAGAWMRDNAPPLLPSVLQVETQQEPGGTLPSLPVASGTTERRERKPFDHFNKVADFPALLRKWGWKEDGAPDAEGRSKWTRPGKDGGVSATLKGQNFHVFTSSIPQLEAGKNYSPSDFFIAMAHGGDRSAAAGDLRRQGYGDRVKDPAIEEEPLYCDGMQPPEEEPMFIDEDLPPEEPIFCDGMPPEEEEEPMFVDGQEDGEEKPLLVGPPKPTLQPRSFFKSYDASQETPLLAGGILSSGSLASFIGAGGLGKSRLVFDLACALATGRSWCGLPVHKSGVKTAIVCTENTPRRWKQDHERLRLSPEEEAMIEACVHCLALVPGSYANLQLSPTGEATLKGLLQGGDYGLVVLDPWMAFSAADSENDNTQVAKSIQTFQRILAEVAPGAAALIVHHARTGREAQAQAGDVFSAGNFARGAKALYSAVRTELQLAPDEDGVRVLACGKSNDAKGFAPRGVKLSEETGFYEVVPDWTEEAWRQRMAGKRQAGSVTCSDVVALVRELQPEPGGQVQTKDIVATGEARGLGSQRTIKSRLTQAVKHKLLKQERVGYYSIG
jgi:hypothetical protein